MKLILFVLILFFAGFAYLVVTVTNNELNDLRTHGATTGSVEAESGVINGSVSTGTDSAASGGKFISLNTATTAVSGQSLGPFGPTAQISCPAGSVSINPGSGIQNAVNANPGTTVFCLKAGIHYLVSYITPKTGNSFIGEYGAILDGTNWTTTDPDAGAFKAHNQDIDDVTIRNLVIRNMPKKGIHAYPYMSDRWTIENNEIMNNTTGLTIPNNSVIRHNYIHNNIGNPTSTVYAERGGGYTAFKATNDVFENNEISYNGPEQKIVGSTNITFRNNFVHHNYSDGIWYDTDNTGSIIEGNVVEDHSREGIDNEISGQAVIRNNTVRRSGDAGIFISTSKDAQITGNTLEDNFRGIEYFLNCGVVGGGGIGWDLTNNSADNNTVKINATSGAFTNVFSYTGTCTSTQVAPYVNRSKNLTFTNNHYYTPTLTGKYWVWGISSLKLWSEWQALGQDVQGSDSLTSSYAAQQ